MRQALFQKAMRGHPTSETYTLPAPVGGLNLRDSKANMPETDATVLENWFPETNDVRVRKGIEDHVTGITGQVESLMPYNAADGTQTLFAAANSAFYNVTSAGTVGSAVQSSLTNIRWQSENFSNSSGTAYLMCFNGADAPRYWDGSSWTSITGVSTPAITGLTTTEIIHCAVHKRRVWLVLTDSLDAYYLPVDAVGGEAKPIRLGGIANKGGYLMAIGTWTIDAGEGADDYWVAYTSEGQVIVYKGTDPTSSSTWNLHGVWDIGAPIGRRCMEKYSSDLLLLSVHGAIPFSKLMVSGQTDPSIAITNKIEDGILKAATNNKANYGWQQFYYPEADMVMINIPEDEGSNQYQYAMNTITGAWGRFEGIEANCWASLGGVAYYGGSTVVGTFWQELDDNGANIETDLKQAETYFGARGRLKGFKLTRPLFLSDGTPQVGVRINTDYQDEPVTEVASYVVNSVGLWDTGLWDDAIWGGNLIANKEWRVTGGVGTSGAIRAKTISAAIEVRLQSSDCVFEYGGVVA